MSPALHHPTTLRPSPRTQRRPFFAGVSVAALAMLAVLTACGRSDAEASDTTPRAIPVEIEQVQLRDLAPPVVATGALGGKEEVTLSFTTGGIIARILVEEGAPVRAGQVLAALTPTPVSAEVAKAEQGKLKAERDLSRVRTLHADSIATTEQLQDATTALAVAEQTLRSARFALDHSVIRAPSSGVVLRRTAEPNQMIGAGVAVLTVRTAQRGVVLRAGLPDRDAVRVHLGDSARVTFDALPGEPFRARVTQRASAASPMSGTYAVELTLEPRAESLASGLIGRAEIRARTEGQVAAIPLASLVEADGDSATIFVVKDGGDRGTRRQVHVARIVGDQVAIASGVTPGEWVVVRGAAYIDEGTRLDVRSGRAIDAAAAAATAAKAGKGDK